MIFSLIILAMIGAVAFFHYVQGLFSATISAILTVLAAALAVSYAEPLVLQFFAGGKFVDYAYSFVLVALFAVVYTVLRFLFDWAVPGNVRLPVLLDKIGAGTMGLIAGIFGAGIFALAAEAMPFGTSFGMYTLYGIKQSERLVPSKDERGRGIDAYLFDQLDTMTLDNTDQRGGPLIPASDMLVGLVSRLSNGSLAGTRPLASVHPDLVTSLYGQRLGQEIGDERTVLPEEVSVVGVYSFSKPVKQVSGQPKGVHALEKTELTPGNDQTILVVRAQLNAEAAGQNSIVRFSTGATHLVAGAGQGRGREWRNYFPVGTLDTGDLLFVSGPDDPLFAKGGSMVDFVFVVDNAAVFGRPAGGGAGAAAAAGDQGGRKIRDGTAFVFKRFGRVDLSGKEVAGAPPRDANVQVIRPAQVLIEAGRPPPPKS